MVQHEIPTMVYLRRRRDTQSWGKNRHTVLKTNLSKKLLESYLSSRYHFSAAAVPARTRAAVPKETIEGAIVYVYGIEKGTDTIKRMCLWILVTRDYDGSIRQRTSRMLLNVQDAFSTGQNDRDTGRQRSWAGGLLLNHLYRDIWTKPVTPTSMTKGKGTFTTHP